MLLVVVILGRQSHNKQNKTERVVTHVVWFVYLCAQVSAAVRARPVAVWIKRDESGDCLSLQPSLDIKQILGSEDRLLGPRNILTSLHPSHTLSDYFITYHD